MQWKSDLPSSWEEAPLNPPHDEREPLELVSVNGGYLIRPTIEPEEGDVGSNSIFSTETVEDHHTAKEGEP